MGLISAFLFFVWPVSDAARLASRSICEDDRRSCPVTSCRPVRGYSVFRALPSSFQGSPLKELQPGDFVRIR